MSSARRGRWLGLGSGLGLGLGLLGLVAHHAGHEGRVELARHMVGRQAVAVVDEPRRDEGLVREGAT